MGKTHHIKLNHEELKHLQMFIQRHEQMEMRQHPELRRALRKINKEYQRAFMFEETKLGGYPLQALKYMPPAVPV